MPKRKKSSPKRPKKASHVGSPSRPAMNRSMSQSTDSDSSDTEMKSSICEEIITREKYTRRRLMERFENTKLEVIMECDNPIMLWVMDRNDSFKQNFDVFDSFSLHLLTKWHEYKQKWRDDVPDKAVAERLRFIMNLFKVAGKPLVYNSQNSSWCDVQYEDMKGLGKSSDESAEKGTQDEKDIPGKDEKTEKDSLDEKDSSGKGDNRKDTDKCLSIMELIFARNLGRSIQLALVRRMHNSVGRDLVKYLLEAALYVCYGDMFNDYAQVIHVGTSKSEAEGFPLAVVKGTSQMADKITSQPSPSTSQERETLRSPQPTQRKRSRSRSASTETKMEWPGTSIGIAEYSPARSMGTSSRATSPASSVRKPKLPHVFTDCVAVSMVHKEFPRYLFVVEIKSCDCLTPTDVAQLKKEMLGAGIHQNEVIGMLINQISAKIFKMNVDTKKKVIFFSQVTEVRFAEGLAETDDKDAFSVEQFYDLFLDVVGLLDYANTNISEVKHF